MNGDLFSPYRPALVRGSATSEAAAHSVKVTASTLRMRVLDFITKQGLSGATCDEIEAALELRHQTASARVNELHYKHNVIQDSGRQRKTRSGRSAVVWVIYRPKETQSKQPYGGSK